MDGTFLTVVWILVVEMQMSLGQENGIIRLGYITGSKRPNTDKMSMYRKPGQVISGAITLAVNEINNDTTVLPNHKLEFVIAETYGEEAISVRETAMLPNKNISAYIGPQETCVHEAFIARGFNLPMISYYCPDYEVSDKDMYPTFLRTRPPDSQISKSVVSLLLGQNWKKVSFIYSSKFAHIADTISELLKENEISVSNTRMFTGPYFHGHGENPFVRIVKDTYITTRIYVMLAEHYEFVGLMSHLQNKGLLDTGEYFVIGVQPYQYDPIAPASYIQGKYFRYPIRLHMSRQQ
ncbi:unnamed protein product [Owenia fusiformis]|uniref:Receptor ligand binding region domain-containing protein n=1 Tax=Owenia fusiformis TaxID=6347 RepID=A0A8S4PLM9_OWEFU|nr:unnamed protein product [Owenia fusiformis]